MFRPGPPLCCLGPLLLLVLLQGLAGAAEVQLGPENISESQVYAGELGARLQVVFQPPPGGVVDVGSGT